MLAIIVFAAAAVVGAALAVLHFRQKGLSTPLAVGHGLFAAGGLVALLALGLSGDLAASWRLAFGLFVAAALGGFVLFAMHLRKKRLSSALVVVHAAAALAGFAVLVLALGGS